MQEPMGSGQDGLLDAIRARRAGVDAYVQEQGPASSRLSTISIVSSAVAAALTAGPALGGTDFAETVQDGLALDRSQTVWRVLCFAALAVSLTAAVSVNLQKANDLPARLAAAGTAGALLDGLEARLRFGGMAVADAAAEYREIVATVPFVPRVRLDREGGTSEAGGGAARAGRRWTDSAVRLAVVPVLGAVLLLAVLVGLARGMSAAPEPGAAAPPAATAPPAAEPSPSATAVVGPAVFGGRTTAGGISLAIVTGDGEAAAYLCDGRAIEAWLSGPVVGDGMELAGQDGATLTGTVRGDLVSGEVSTPAVTTPFVARAAEEPTGVYRADVQVGGADARVGWAVLPDGSQVGIVNVDGELDPAPPLDPADRTFRLDGELHEAQRLAP
ncbi:hypothetical protein GCM10023328_40610 [Modestobacter marinus]|uniref:Uncharacterized protein n=1 Tax=Modestobacter marinus TaxID=477641 RepID=A0A846LM01_9ACTN|nr:hypothetical protein [Modestobacter marinus]NIH68636.1 hypothetical protein [Modestobacter marinus]GGL58887.1 hypothetical protein GCM10011589_13580 [Modestobacter marinus]